MGECNNFTFVCPSIHSGVPYLGVPTLALGEPTLGKSLPWLGVPTLVRGTYPDLGTYLCWGYLPWQEESYLPWLGYTYPGLEVSTFTRKGTYLG